MTERELFLAAIEKPAADRPAFLAAAAGADAELHARVRELVEAHEKSGTFLGPGADTPGFSVSADDAEPLPFLTAAEETGSIGRLAHYEITDRLGRGGCGIVLKAVDTLLRRVVAVKVMLPELAATSPARKRFLREARAAAAVRHANVVGVFATEEKPVPFLVMEYVAGPTLQKLLDETGPLPARDAARYAAEVARGLAAAHATGLIHRDVKPANVLIDDGVAKLTDFGLARAADDATLTKSGYISGTPLYMSPEQARGEPLDPRTDLFSLGSLTYALVTGRPPFRAESSLAVLKRVAEEPHRPVRDVMPETPESLVAVIDRLLAKSPADRYPDAAAAAADLDAVAVGAAVVRRRRRRPGVAAGLMVVAAVAGGLFALGGGEGAKPVAEPIEPPPAATPPATQVAPTPTPPPAKAVYPAADYDDLPGGPWIDLLPDVAAFDAAVAARKKSELGIPSKFRGTFDGTTLTLGDGALVFPIPPLRDGIIRARVKRVSARNVNLRFRVGDDRRMVSAGKTDAAGWVYSGRIADEWKDFGSTIVPKLDEGGWIDLALAVVGDRVTTFVGGKRVLVEELDVPIGPGRLGVGAYDPGGSGIGQFRDVQYRAVVMPPVEADTATRDRNAVRSVQAFGGSGTIRVAGKDVEFNAATVLPKVPFSLVRVGLSTKPMERSADPLARLRGCEDLEHVFFHSSRVYDADLAFLADCPKLRYLNLTQTQCRGRALKYLKNAHGLNELWTWGVRLHDDDVAHLAGKDMLVVDFGTAAITDRCRPTLATWRNLTYLRLAMNGVTSDVLADAANWPGLEELLVYGTKIDDAGAASVAAGCPKLRIADFNGTRLTDRGLAKLAKLPFLKELTVSKTGVTAAGVAAIKAARPGCKVKWDGSPDGK